MSLVTGGLLRGFGPSGGSGPTRPALSVADNGDGTAAATISGSAAGSTNAIYTVALNDDMGIGGAINSGSRIGDGDVTLELASGLYFAQAVSLLNSQTMASRGWVFFRVTNGEEAVYHQVLDAIQARVRLLNLDGLPSANVKRQKVPSDLGMNSSGGDFPAVLIAPVPDAGEFADATSGTLGRDDYGYPVVVMIMATDPGQDQLENHGRWLLWRSRIMRAFQNQRLPGISGGDAYTCQVEPRAVTLRDPWINDSLFVSGMVIRCFARETRGMS